MQLYNSAPCVTQRKDGISEVSITSGVFLNKKKPCGWLLPNKSKIPPETASRGFDGRGRTGECVRKSVNLPFFPRPEHRLQGNWPVPQTRYHITLLPTTPGRVPGCAGAVASVSADLLRRMRFGGRREARRTSQSAGAESQRSGRVGLFSRCWFSAPVWGLGFVSSSCVFPGPAPCGEILFSLCPLFGPHLAGGFPEVDTSSLGIVNTC